MNWADRAIQKLQSGEKATIQPKGHSMKPKVKSGEKVILSPFTSGGPECGDIVLVKVKGRVYLHLVKAIDGERYQIANNKGHINGWVGLNSIYGKAVEFPDRLAKGKSPKL